MCKVNVAIVGATGLVGKNFLKVLEERNFPIENLYLFASERSAGKKVLFKNNEYIIEKLSEDSFNRKIDVALFSAGAKISKKFAPIAACKGCIVIDNSSAWRMDPTVPLIVPEVNPEDINNQKGIIANPNCSTIQAVIALKPLHDKFKIKRAVISTYQAVSGAGANGIKDLRNGMNGIPPKKFLHPIVNNCIPHIDDFNEMGYTKEELKLMNEIKKILHDQEIKITATAVRVPVINCHSESINLEFENQFDFGQIIATLEKFNGIKIKNNTTENEYPMPIDASGTDDVFVGRIRRDFTVDNGINLWVVADNIRKGAATNAVQIAELIFFKEEVENDI